MVACCSWLQLTTAAGIPLRKLKGCMTSGGRLPFTGNALIATWLSSTSVFRAPAAAAAAAATACCWDMHTSSHCPCRKIPNGIHGIEERLHIVWETLVNSGLATASDFVRLTSTAAAKIFNIYPRKGAVQPGSDADVIIFDPHKKHTMGADVHFSALDTSIYEGMEITGKVRLTIRSFH